MELPPPRSFGPDGRKSTHDFLTLYSSHSSIHHQQDPRPSPGNFLKTQNFLQPLERVEMISAKEDNGAAGSKKDKTPISALAHSAPNSVEHILPGGIGTYTISHISCINQLPKPEVSIFEVAQASSNTNDRNNDNSNCSSYSGSGFTLWEESVAHKGKTGKENAVDRRSIIKDPAAKLGQWTAERPSKSSLNHCNSFGPASTSQMSMPRKRSFMDLIVSTKSSREDDEDCGVDFVIKKEGSHSEKEDLNIREGKDTERKANTPRSKHSATEQRRRSKINDRFQMLREIIPHSDQKRDKASFLLEAIEYIQYLQEKVHRYEGSFPRWNHEYSKKIPSKSNHHQNEGIVHRGSLQGETGSASLLSTKFGDKSVRATSTVSRVAQKQGESDNATAFRLNDQSLGTNSGVSCPILSQPKIYLGSGGTTQCPPRLASEAEASTSQHQLQGDVTWCKTKCPSPNDELNGQELAIEGGTINISSTYSEGFLVTLTQALQSLGVDLSHSKISAQIDLGKQNNIKLGSQATAAKQFGESNSTNHLKANSSLPRTSEQSDHQAAKRPRTGSY